MSCFRPSIEGWRRCRAVGRVNKNVWYKFDALHDILGIPRSEGKGSGVAWSVGCGGFHCTVGRVINQF